MDVRRLAFIRTEKDKMIWTILKYSRHIVFLPLYIKNPIFPLGSFELLDQRPRQVAEVLAKENISVWDGNYGVYPAGVLPAGP